MYVCVCVECVQLCDGRRQLAAHIEMPHQPEGDAATRDPVPRFARRSSRVYNIVVNKSAFTHTAQHKTYMQALLQQQQQQRPGRFERQRRRWRLLHFNSSAIGFVHNRTHARAHAQGVSSGVGQLHACTCHWHCEPSLTNYNRSVACIQLRDYHGIFACSCSCPFLCCRKTHCLLEWRRWGGMGDHASRGLFVCRCHSY